MKSALISKQITEISDLKTENSKLKKECDCKDALIRKHKKQKNLLKNTNDSLRAGNLPKSTKERAVYNVLEGKFTCAQISQMIKSKKEPIKNGKLPISRMKKISYSDYRVALPVRNAGGRKCYNLLRNNMNFPMPGISTMNKEFMWIFTLLIFISNL